MYEEIGFDSRQEYLANIALEYGYSYDVVATLAEVLGKNEDFDGLISILEEANYIGL